MPPSSIDEGAIAPALEYLEIMKKRFLEINCLVIFFMNQNRDHRVARDSLINSLKLSSIRSNKIP